MDNRRFDSFVKRLAAAKNRRSFLGGLLGLSGAAMVGAALEHGANAARRGYSGPPSPTVPAPPPPPPTAVPPVASTTTVGCASGSTACGSACCPDATSMCCDGTCCYGWCYGEELCCETPRQYCAENNTCCATGEICCITSGTCLDVTNGACCTTDDCHNGGKCCPDFNICLQPGQCCNNFDCPSGETCLQDHSCCKTTCEPGFCHLDGCGGICPCPPGYSCLQNGTCARECEPGSVFCEEHACGTCFVEVPGNTGYCADETHGAACQFTGDCPAGQFCTPLDPPTHCVTACGA